MDQKGRKIAIYNEDGKVLHVIERTGKGPSEYGRILEAALDRDCKQILVASDNDSLIRYDYDARFIEETKRMMCYVQEITIKDSQIAIYSPT